MEPPPSLPCATGTRPAATAAPAPPLDPPGVRSALHGFRVAPFSSDSVKAVVPNSFTIAIARGGRPVRGADVTTTFTMLDMEMGQQAYHFTEVAPGVYRKAVPALVMVGHWGLQFEVQPPGGGPPFTVLVVDKANG